MQASHEDGVRGGPCGIRWYRERMKGGFVWGYLLLLGTARKRGQGVMQRCKYDLQITIGVDAGCKKVVLKCWVHVQGWKSLVGW